MSLIISWSPTYAFFFNPWVWGEFSIDLQRFRRLVDGELRKRPKLIPSPTLGDVKRLWTEPYITVDIETKPANNTEPWTGKDPTRARLNLLGLGTSDVGLSHRWGTDAKIEAEIKKLLASKHISKVFQNGPWFDIRVLKRFGVEVQNWEDTRDARRATCSTSPLSLEYLASIFDDAPLWKGKHKDFDSEVYNATDCVETARSWDGICAEPDWGDEGRGGRGRVAQLYAQHKRLSVIAAEMHTHGFRVDKKTRDFMMWGMQVEFEEKRKKLVDTVNVSGFRGTPNDMRAIIYKRHEKGALRKFSLDDPMDQSMWTDPKRMDCISVDFDSLVLLLVDPDVPAELAKIIDLYWEASEVQKARSTFVASELISQAIGPDGRLRAGWNSCGTDTGRFSCSEPNLMNIEQWLRAMYVAAPGCVLVHGDFSQLEIRVMSIIADDATLREHLSTGDVYSALAKAMFRLPADMDVKKLKPKARQSAKITHLGSQYGAVTKTLFKQALRQDRGLKFRAVALQHDEWKRTYHRTVSYWGEEMSRVHNTGYSESRIMHRRRVYPRLPELSEVANYPIQSTAADIANLALIKLDRQLKKHVPTAKIIVQLHDAFDVECRKRDQGVVKRIMQEAMETPREIEGRSYVFPVEIKVAERWSEV